MDWSEGKKEVSEVTIKQLDSICAEYVAKEAEAARIDKLLKEVNKEIDSLSFRILKILKESDKEVWATEHGTFKIKQRFSVKVPKTSEEKELFFSYLKEKNIFDDLITVNSRTLNSWHEQEMNSALERGDVGFKVPGIEEATLFETLSFK